MHDGDLDILGVGKSQAYYGEEGMAAQGLQDFAWQQFFSDPTHWWDNRRREENSLPSDFRHKKPRNAMWLNNLYKPAWVASLPDVGKRGPSDSTSVNGRLGRLGLYQGDLENGTCSKLCVDGHVTEAVDTLNLLLQRGCRIPHIFFYRILKRCIAQKDLVLGRRIHALTVESGYEGNAFLATHLIGLYASHGRLGEAMRVFSAVTQPSVYNWASIIFAYARHGEPNHAISLYREMRESTVEPDNRVFVAVLKACASAGDLAVGKDIHAHIGSSGVEPDIFVQTCLVCMYAKCGSLKDAQELFDRLSQKDVVTWTAMISGYAQRGMGVEALTLYRSMQLEGLAFPNSVTFVCLLQACACVGVGALQQGQQLHAQIEERAMQTDMVIGASLVNMYAKCGQLEDARSIFDRLPHRDVVTWSAMIAGYAQQGMGQEALSLYASMQQEGLTPPDTVTFVCLLQACACVAALPLGKQLHAQIEERGWQDDVVIGNSLVNMYAKCGSMGDAQQVFDSLPEGDVVSWNAMIAGHARQGDSEVVFDLVLRMRQHGIKPDGITVLNVLTVCSHLGLVDKGRQYFEAMNTVYGIRPNIEHYTCMVDLLGRAGQLDEALMMIRTMPFQSDGRVWRTLLGACRKWMNVEVGRQAFDFAVKLDGKDASPYILMSNIYAGVQMWEEAKEMQAMRVKCGAHKEPGRSWWTDMEGVVHTFVVRE